MMRTFTPASYDFDLEYTWKRNQIGKWKIIGNAGLQQNEHLEGQKYHKLNTISPLQTTFCFQGMHIQPVLEKEACYGPAHRFPH